MHIFRRAILTLKAAQKYAEDCIMHYQLAQGRIVQILLFFQ